MLEIKGAVAGSAGCAIDANRAQTKEPYRRAAMISDIAGAMSNGFKAEPDLSPCHLPLLSTEALDRVHKESETWRDKSHERALERMLETMTQSERSVSGYYVDIRGIIGALNVPDNFISTNSKPLHVQYTELKASELVKKAEDSDKLNIRINELENIIGRARSAYLHGTPATAATQMFVILGEFKSDEHAWLNWSFDFMPQGLAEDTTVEIQTNDGVYFTLSAGSVKWSVVAKYRRVK